VKSPISDRLVGRRHLPRPTVRLRLTLLYGLLFLISGAALLAITYLLARAGQFITINTRTPLVRTAPPTHGRLPPGASIRHTPLGAHQQSVIDLHQLLVLSALALAIMALVSIVLGWLVAGRVLRPLRTIISAARQISTTNLHQRLALAGPDDELTELGHTFDELLARLERSFTAQRQFIAHASHELRTPLARQRTLLEIALSDHDATVHALQTNNKRLLAAGEQQEQLIEALLTLARSERAGEPAEPLDLAAISRELLRLREPTISDHGLHLATSLASAPITGDRHLTERLIANLLDNAIRHNTPSGHIEIQTTLQNATGASSDHAVITVANSGPLISTADMNRLFEPFQRLDPQRHARNDGSGLGLSIVRAIATAHHATITAQPLPHGGLKVQVSFPRADSGGEDYNPARTVAVQGSATPR
jgi:signal transduction histidine kinase